MNNNIRIEVALEILAMQTGLEFHKGNTSNVNKIENIRKQIYEANLSCVNYVYNEYCML